VELMAKLDFDVYGRHPVIEALRAGHAARVYVAREARDAPVMRELHEAARDAGVPVQAVPRADLDRMLANRNHQGVAAAYHQHDYATLDDIQAVAERSGEPGLVLALDGVQDPGNVGSLLRSAEGGAAEHLAIAQEANLTRTLEWFKRIGYWTVGLSEDATTPYDELDATRPLVVVVGGEGKGLGRLVGEACDYRVRLPMRGRVESLNAAVSGAILLYEIRRQRDHEVESRKSEVESR